MTIKDFDLDAAIASQKQKILSVFVEHKKEVCEKLDILEACFNKAFPQVESILQILEDFYSGEYKYFVEKYYGSFRIRFIKSDDFYKIFPISIKLESDRAKLVIEGDSSLAGLFKTYEEAVECCEELSSSSNLYDEYYIHMDAVLGIIDKEKLQKSIDNRERILKSELERHKKSY